LPVTINRFHLFVSGVLEILLAFFDKLYTLINRILVFFDVMYCCAIPVLTQRLFTATSGTIVVCLRTTSAFQVFVLNAFLECAFSAAHQTRLNPENTLVLVGHYKPLFLTESLSWPLSVEGIINFCRSCRLWPLWPRKRFPERPYKTRSHTGYDTKKPYRKFQAQNPTSLFFLRNGVSVFNS
jgi:hypothetical protein